MLNFSVRFVLKQVLELIGYLPGSNKQFNITFITIQLIQSKGAKYFIKLKSCSSCYSNINCIHIDQYTGKTEKKIVFYLTKFRLPALRLAVGYWFTSHSWILCTSGGWILLSKVFQFFPKVFF